MPDEVTGAGLETVVGSVRVGTAARGSKSEQHTVTLVAEERVWLLRRADGPRWGVDPVLAKLDGVRIRAAGHKGAGTFLLTSWEVVDD